MKRKSKPSQKAKTISVYFEDALHDALKARAKACGRSLSGHLRFITLQDLNSQKAA